MQTPTPLIDLALTPADFRCWCDLAPRFRDLDAMGHVNNAVYFTFMEVARTRYVRDLQPGTPQPAAFAERFPFILAHAECRYLSAVTLDEAVRAGRIERGDTLLLEGVGGGFTWGATLLKF